MSVCTLDTFYSHFFREALCDDPAHESCYVNKVTYVLIARIKGSSSFINV